MNLLLVWVSNGFPDCEGVQPTGKCLTSDGLSGVQEHIVQETWMLGSWSPNVAVAGRIWAA